MTKDVLTLENVKRDLLDLVNTQKYVKFEWRFSYIVPAVAVAVTFYTHFGTYVPAIFCIPFALYHLVKYILDTRQILARKAAVRKAIDRGDVSVTLEKLSHIARESIFEPHIAGFGRFKRQKALKEAKFYHFDSGRCWRDPLFTLDAGKEYHYEWSRELKLSSGGLDVTSVKGNEFYFISLQASYDVAYIYPAKFFELGAELKSKEE